MFSASIDSVFSLPLRHIWGTEFGQDLGWSNAAGGEATSFVGDDANALVRCFLDPNIPNQLDWPVVLTGPSGTGKTVLALAIVSEAYQASTAGQIGSDTPSPSPVYLTALDFSRRYQSAVQTDSVNEFRQRLANCGGLVIDNYQDFEGKHSTQTELIHLIDACLKTRLPLVFTGNMAPGESEWLLQPIRSRLVGGLHIPIVSPGPQAMRVLIREMMQSHELNFRPETSDFLADNLKVTVPKLNQFLCDLKIRIKAKQILDPISIPVLQTLLGQFDSKDYDIHECPIAQALVQRVADEFQIKPAALKTNSRKQTIVLARGVAIYLIRSMVGASFQKIGSLFGNRDHSTVIHAFRKIESELSEANQNNLSMIVERVRLAVMDQFPYLLISKTAPSKSET